MGQAQDFLVQIGSRSERFYDKSMTSILQGMSCSIAGVQCVHVRAVDAAELRWLIFKGSVG